MSERFNQITRKRRYDGEAFSFDEMEEITKNYEVFSSEDLTYSEIDFELAEQMLEEDILNERIKEKLKKSIKIAKEKGVGYLAFELF